MAKEETVKAENIISIADAEKVIALSRQERQQQLLTSLEQWQQDNNATLAVYAIREGVTVPISWILPPGWGVAIIPRGK